MPRQLKRGQPQGQTHSKARLTENQVKEILKRLEAGELQRTLAEEFGVTPSNISHIKRGVSWSYLGGMKKASNQKVGSERASAKLTEEDIPVIIQRVERGESLTSVAKSYGVSRTTVADIWHGRRWKHVERPQKRRRKVYEDIYS